MPFVSSDLPLQEATVGPGPRRSAPDPQRAAVIRAARELAAGARDAPDAHIARRAAAPHELALWLLQLGLQLSEVAWHRSLEERADAHIEVFGLLARVAEEGEIETIQLRKVAGTRGQTAIPALI